MPNKENLISLKDRSKAEVKKIAAMGGRASNKNGKNSIGVKMAWLRRKGLTNKGAQELMMLMEDANFSSLDILRHINKLKDMVQDNKEAAVVIDKMMQWHKLQHGDRKSVELRVGVVDLNAPLEPSVVSLLLEDVVDE